VRCPTNLVTCRRWRRYVKQCGKSVPAILVVFILLVGCAGEPSAPGAARDRFTVLPTPDGVESQPSPTPTENPALAIPEFVVGLLDPGPTLDPIERVFFRNGRDLWQLTGDEVNPALPQGTRFGPYDTAPQGQRVAIVILTEIDSQPAEAIHIIEWRRPRGATSPAASHRRPERGSGNNSACLVVGRYPARRRL
jgi:hypothetical protein